MTGEELYELFGKYGAIRQIRLGVNNPAGASTTTSLNDTRGTAYVVFEDLYDAKQACDHLSGFNFQGRYLIVVYYQPSKMFKKLDLQKQQEEIDAMRKLKDAQR